MREIRTLLQKGCSGAPARARLGAESFLNRFGFPLDSRFRFHLVIVDGLFSEEARGALQFHPASDLAGREMQRLQQTLRRRVLNLFGAATSRRAPLAGTRT
jgi:hypothetical protein